MFSIIQETLPEDSLLKTYRGGAHPERWGANGDCFAVTVGYPVSLRDFVVAFYTSPLFRIERLLLRIVVNAPSSRRQAHAVAEGSAAEFAAWYVGERTATQLLMCDRYERTRSWFCVAPVNGGTRLRFGSAVVGSRDTLAGAMTLGGSFPWLLRFHVLYSQLLLHAAKKRLGGVG